MNGERLRKAMVKKGLNQYQLADAAFVSPATISHYVKGKRGIYFDSLVSICKVLDVSADYLLGLSDDMGGGTS